MKRAIRTVTPQLSSEEQGRKPPSVPGPPLLPPLAQRNPKPKGAGIPSDLAMVSSTLAHRSLENYLERRT